MKGITIEIGNRTCSLYSLVFFALQVTTQRNMEQHQKRDYQRKRKKVSNLWENGRRNESA